MTSSTATLASPHLLVRRAGASDLARLSDAWNLLAGDIPFRRWEWLEAWWRHYATPGRELLVLAVEDDEGELLGLAPWYVERIGWRGRVIRALGSGEVASDYVGAFALPGCEQRVTEALGEWLTTEGRDAWDLIELTGIGASDATPWLLAEELATHGHAVHRRAPLNAWRVELPGTWNEYVARLSKSRRERVRQLVRRMFDTGRAALHVVDRHEDVARGLDILHDLHQRRRESLGEPGCFSSPRFLAFHSTVAERFHQLGRLRLQWLELDGRPVAAEYSFGGGDTVYYYQSGFDPALADERPGWLELIASLRRAIDEGFHCFDFLRGDEPYKASLGGEPVPLSEIRIAGGRTLSAARHRIWQASARLKHLLAPSPRQQAHE